MINSNDAVRISFLQDQGYFVTVDDAYGDTFNERYTVYQSVNTEKFKTVIINEMGEAVGAQG